MTENLLGTIPAGYRDYHGGYFRTLISPEATNGAMALIEMALPKGAEPPLHTHELEDEAFYVQEGELEFVIGDKIYRILDNGRLLQQMNTVVHIDPAAPAAELTVDYHY